MSGFHDVRLPVRIEKGAEGGPQFNTTVIELSSGLEQRNIEWSRARATWDISYGVQTGAQYQEVMAFFYARYGRAYGFRFKDWSDYQGTTQTIGTGDGAALTFQLVKAYTDTAGAYTRKITRPVTGTVKIYLNTVLQTTGYSVNYSTGVVTFVSAPGIGVVVTADYEFDVPVRFEDDLMKINLDWVDVGDIPAITIREIKE